MLFQFKSEEIQERIVSRLAYLDRTIRNMPACADYSKELKEESDLNITLKVCYITKTVLLTQQEVVILFEEIF